ncbi:hypothetical protein AUEXF2481DRAFT_77969 [Aureobasidium subglaciale EXF-2481]|uniref:Uncharacterized protein n=1 Tax=Aureobasidium subglaciale (strain EXF-2481) TaxID=1043005 RepID=A0A074YST8_AURSE|nr:uncharacterized protein AUEXF2481DRAFT_77969 [Aureobasidium subglaciale EXF-2481]KAI5200596.1 hypothetical protein E4T38_06415 [Aureobasidium subglaciale]KAI5219382.1 hypothetical protein E4T40_06437 [Aureobasidium subglaciale]KAI5222995.1 hypothetical protein E4T41_06277 [Aureobasidium subglaciale]KAI5260269.1 hypothetical protein E4T46_06067 [Aureobasidium subglaciale]KEQ97152.1 hypothetical protein AUEXF2481DRAFT_77969 [Aureobasidium subglaciale EXF-2481]
MRQGHPLSFDPKKELCGRVFLRTHVLIFEGRHYGRKEAKGSRTALEGYVEEVRLANQVLAIENAFKDQYDYIVDLQNDHVALTVDNDDYVKALVERDNTIDTLTEQVKTLTRDRETAIATLEEQLKAAGKNYEDLEEKSNQCYKELQDSKTVLASVDIDQAMVDKFFSERSTAAEALAVAEAAAKQLTEENEEYKTVDAELRVLLQAAEAEISEDSKLLRIMELIRIKQMHVRGIKRLMESSNPPERTSKGEHGDDLESLRGLEAIQLPRQRDDEIARLKRQAQENEATIVAMRNDKNFIACAYRGEAWKQAGGLERTEMLKDCCATTAEHPIESTSEKADMHGI